MPLLKKEIKRYLKGKTTPHSHIGSVLKAIENLTILYKKRKRIK